MIINLKSIYFNFIFERQRERGKEGERVKREEKRERKLYLLSHFPNVQHNRDWASTKSGVQNCLAPELKRLTRHLLLAEVCTSRGTGQGTPVWAVGFTSSDVTTASNAPRFLFGKALMNSFPK